MVEIPDLGKCSAILNAAEWDSEYAVNLDVIPALYTANRSELVIGTVGSKGDTNAASIS
jgi:hypothetical protein